MNVKTICLFLFLLLGNNMYCQEIHSDSVKIILNNINKTWKKGETLNLSGKVVNSSSSNIILICPKKEIRFHPDLYKIIFPDDFQGRECAYQSALDERYAKSYDFIIIEAGNEKSIYFQGAKYSLDYCSDSKIKRDSINVFVQYKGISCNYDTNSYIIKEKYKNIKEIYGEIELNKIIDFYNGLYTGEIKSNTVTVRIEN